MAYPVSGSPFGTGAATPSPAYAGVFIPEVWSGKLVEKFYAATVLGAIANTDYEGEIKNYGDTVQIRQRPDVTIRAYSADQDLNVDRPSVDKISMAVDQGLYFNVALDDVMEIQADIDHLSIWAEDAAEQMKIEVDTDVLTYLTDVGTVGNGFDDIDAANKGATAGAVSGDIDLGTNVTATTGQIHIANTGGEATPIEYILRCGQVLDEANIPETGRFMVIPAWLAALIKNSELKDASLAGDGTSIVRNGRLGMIDRFTLYLSNLLDDQETAGKWPVLFGTNAGFSFASQFTKLETIRSERSFANLLRGLQVYGRKVVNGKCLGVGFVGKDNAA
jgi:hypothetical protein